MYLSSFAYVHHTSSSNPTIFVVCQQISYLCYCLRLIHGYKKKSAKTIYDRYDGITNDPRSNSVMRLWTASADI